MITRYRLLAERLRAELELLDQVVTRADGAVSRATQEARDRDYFLAAAALDLHGFYVGVERLFELIADEIDHARQAGPDWHRGLLTQMTLDLAGVRPAVISSGTRSALSDYLAFWHVVRNVYTFTLRPERILELVQGFRPAFEQVEHDLLAFADFLDQLATADQSESRSS